MTDHRAQESPSAADLYGIELDGFTAARNALAKQLRASGERDEAARVAKLRKPPVTVWALNQVARREPARIQAVVDCADDLRAAMDQALQGDASAVREAQAREREAVDAALDAAVALAESSGRQLSEQHRQRMGQTLRGAMVDDEAAAALVAGVLDRDVDASGLGMGGLSGFADVPASRSPRPAHDDPRGTAVDTETDPDPDPDPDTEAETVAPVAPMAPDPVERRRHEEAVHRLEGLARELDQARALAHRTASALEDARSELTDAERRVAEAEQADRDAKVALRDVEAAVDATRRERDDAAVAMRGGTG